MSSQLMDRTTRNATRSATDQCAHEGASQAVERAASPPCVGVGLVEASAANIVLTQQLREALALVNVRLVDHCIVAGVVSMSQNGDL